MWANISARRCERTYSRQVGFRHWGFSEVQKKRRHRERAITAVVIIIEPVDGAGAGRLLVRTLPIRLYLGCDAPICLPLTTGSIFMTLAVRSRKGISRG